MSAEGCKQIMEIYLNEVLGQRKFDRIPEIAAPGMTDVTQPGRVGPEALLAHAQGFCENTPDVEIDVVRIFADDNTAVGLWTWHGEPKHPSGISAKGSPVIPRNVCSIFEIEDGKIQHYRVYVDAVDVFTQLAQ
jgi:limonene-1,2-epoxide hydrolase